jgi:hypothetical protein
VHTLKNAYHRLHHEELDDFMMIDMLTNAGYHVAGAKDRHVITAADQGDRDALRAKLLHALAEVQPEQGIPEVLAQAVLHLAQEFTSDLSGALVRKIVLLIRGQVDHGTLFCASPITDGGVLLPARDRAAGQDRCADFGGRFVSRGK